MVIVRIPTETQEKIDFLVQTLTTEVGWFGTATVEQTPQGTFVYTLQPELLIYPQRVTGASVNPDDTNDAYDDWWINQLRNGKPLIWHGHSHCNMGCSPSGTDKGLRSKLNLDGGIHIYTIHNKSGSIDLQVFNGADEIHALIQKGDTPIEHEDILIQLGRVKRSTYVAPAPSKYYEKYQEDTWYGKQNYYGFNEYDKAVEEAANNKVERRAVDTSPAAMAEEYVTDVTFRDHEDLLLAEALTDSAFANQDIPSWLLIDMQEQVSEFALELIEEYRIQPGVDVCLQCGTVLNQGTCEFCDAVDTYDAAQNQG